MADTVVPAPPTQARLGGGDGGDVSAARWQRVVELLFPSNLAAKAALFAVVVALLPLLPTIQAPRIWEMPHILLLGLVISYGVFGQRNAGEEVATAPAAAAAKPVDDDESVEAFVSQIMQGPLVFEGNDGYGDGGGAKDGVQAWSSQYYPDDPLVVVADAGSDNGDGNESEKPILLPVRKLNPVAEEESAALKGDVASDDTEEEEEAADFLAAKAGYNGVRDHAIPSPSSVLDVDLTLSPSSPPLLPPPPPPPPPPFLGHGRSLKKAKARSFSEYGRVGLPSIGGNKIRTYSATQATRSTFAGYAPAPAAPFDDQAATDDELDEMAAASDSSFSSDVVTDGDDDIDEKEGDDEGNSFDEELFELAVRPEAEEDEVDKKADEFIAKFREQIRMQRVEPDNS